MIAVCAWCQREGRPAVLGPREPLKQAGETHGICAAHERAELIQLRGLTLGHLDGRARELCGWRVASLGRMHVYSFPMSAAAELFADEALGMVVRGGDPAQHALPFTDLGSLLVPLTRVAVEAAHD